MTEDSRTRVVTNLPLASKLDQMKVVNVLQRHVTATPRHVCTARAAPGWASEDISTCHEESCADTVQPCCQHQGIHL